MKPLTITNESVNRQALLEMAREVPGAWVGLRIAAVLLFMSGWRSARIAGLFGVSRWSVVKWIHHVNGQGINGLREKKRTGRPCMLNEEVQRELARALAGDPGEFGLSSDRWDGSVVVEYLKAVHGIRMHVRQAQRWIRRMGFSSRNPANRLEQADERGAGKFVDQ